MQLDVSVLVILRNAEAWAAGTVREIVATLSKSVEDGPLSFEVLAVDERSFDNTLSLLSVLHGQIPQLRTLQGVEPGTALARAAVVARGRIWAVIDHPVDSELLAWGLSQVFRGHRAAVIPGELLVAAHGLAKPALLRLRGGLVTAQRAVVRHLGRDGHSPAFSPAPSRGWVARALLQLRGRVSHVGLGRLDRPLVRGPHPGNKR